MASEFFEDDYKNKVVLYWIARFCIKNRNKIKTIALKEDWVFQDWQMIFCPIFGKIQCFKSTRNYQENKRSFETFLKNLKVAYPHIRKYKDEIDPIVKKNISLVSKIINFNEIDRKILYFALLINIDHYLRDFIYFLGDKSATEAYEIICQILEINLEDFINAIQRSPLCLILKFYALPFGSREKICEMFEMDKDFFSQLLIPHQNPWKIFNFSLKKVKPGNFFLSDFDHISELDLVQNYLARALNEKEKGVNILIYGPPGTGKTEFTKSLAKHFNVALFEVPIFNESGDLKTPERRLSSLRFAQFLLRQSNQKSMIIVDEAEDLLKENKNFNKINYIGKIHLNELLEVNEVPTIWIVNSPEKIHPAHLRRFDIVIPFSRIPFEKRLKIVRRYTSSLNIDESWCETLAREDVPPAIIARAAKVVSKVNSSNPEKDLEILLKNTLQVMGKHLQLRTNREQMPYLPEILNTDPPVELLSQIAKKNHPVRMLFYGLPGTGKTALAKHFADWTGRPLVIKHGNNLFSPWVGETERLIAEAFEEAERQEAILLIDEIDTFLRSRNLATYSWEISFTNQFLTMIEYYQGWFICTTNFLESLDEASLRRFDFRVNFKPLMPEQAWRLFQELFHEEADERHRERLSRLSLTPGNFATVWHRLRLIDQHRNPDLFLHELKKEQLVTRGEKELRVGFTAN